VPGRLCPRQDLAAELHARAGAQDRARHVLQRGRHRFGVADAAQGPAHRRHRRHRVRRSARSPHSAPACAAGPRGRRRNLEGLGTRRRHLRAAFPRAARAQLSQPRRNGGLRAAGAARRAEAGALSHRLVPCDGAGGRTHRPGPRPVRPLRPGAARGHGRRPARRAAREPHAQRRPEQARPQGAARMAGPDAGAGRQTRAGEPALHDRRVSTAPWRHRRLPCCAGRPGRGGHSRDARRDAGLGWRVAGRVGRLCRSPEERRQDGKDQARHRPAQPDAVLRAEPAGPARTRGLDGGAEILHRRVRHAPAAARYGLGPVGPRRRRAPGRCRVATRGPGLAEQRIPAHGHRRQRQPPRAGGLAGPRITGLDTGGGEPDRARPARGRQALEGRPGAPGLRTPGPGRAAARGRRPTALARRVLQPAPGDLARRAGGHRGAGQPQGRRRVGRCRARHAAVAHQPGRRGPPARGRALGARSRRARAGQGQAGHAVQGEEKPPAGPARRGRGTLHRRLALAARATGHGRHRRQHRAGRPSRVVLCRRTATARGPARGPARAGSAARGPGRRARAFRLPPGRQAAGRPRARPRHALHRHRPQRRGRACASCATHPTRRG
jgi:hypothetical protein